MAQLAESSLFKQEDLSLTPQKFTLNNNNNNDDDDGGDDEVK